MFSQWDSSVAHTPLEVYQQSHLTSGLLSIHPLAKCYSDMKWLSPLTLQVAQAREVVPCWSHCCESLHWQIMCFVVTGLMWSRSWAEVLGVLVSQQGLDIFIGV
jgi:hypothetical protein